MNRKHLKNAVRIAISGGLLVLLFRYGPVDLREVGARMGDALRDHPIALGGALLLYGVLGSLARGMRWRALVRPLGYPMTLWRSTELFLVGMFYNQILPTGMGGDVPKALLAARDGGDDGIGRARAASSVIVDRAMGLLPLLAAGLLALLVASDRATAPVVWLLIAAGIVGVIGLTLMVRADIWRPIGERMPLVGWVLRRPAIARFVASFSEYGGRPLWASAGWGLIFTGLLIASNGLLGIAVGIEQAEWLDWAIIVPLVALSIVLPSVGGWGVREWSYVALLATLRPPADADAATALSLLFQSLNLMLAVVGGVLFLVRGGVVVDLSPEARGATRSVAEPPGTAGSRAEHRTS